jgi:hypothetical protein
MKRSSKMKAVNASILVAVMFAATVMLQAQAKTQSRSVVVESPSDLPEIAQHESEAMFLHDTGDERTVLYLEQNAGRTLVILDVTDPARIRALGQVSVNARAPYDFIQAASDSTALVEYRDHSGFAIIDFKTYKQPVLVETQWQYPARSETLGSNSLLLSSTPALSVPAPDPRYQVVDVSNPSKPATLATIDGVQERLERQDTGTVFLLGSSGVTVVRRPHVEQEYEIHQTQVDSQ